MSRLIDADTLGLNDFEIIMCDGDYKEALKMLLGKIDAAPTIEERKTGKWIRNRGLTPWPICSECGTYGANESYYCSYCGAKMEE